MEAKTLQIAQEKAYPIKLTEKELDRQCYTGFWVSVFGQLVIVAGTSVALSFI